VVKAVLPGARDQFVAGLALARKLQEAGIPAGAPLPTINGQRVASVAGHPVALLTWVPGYGLTGENGQELRLIGTTRPQYPWAVKAVTVAAPDGLGVPHAQQAVRITRTPR
jgi:hypothetical protein